jgi:hypothetical protein
MMDKLATVELQPGMLKGGIMIKKIAAIVVIATTSACATITRGTDQTYVIESDPPGANAALSTGISCTTPCSLRLKRRQSMTVDITRKGYEPVRATVTSGVSGGGGAAMAGNVLVGGIIGAVIDGTNGSMNDLRPNPLRVSLVRLGSGSTSSSMTDVDPATGPRRVRAKTASGYCLDVPRGYIGTGAENSPVVTSAMPRCDQLAAPDDSSALRRSH